MTTEPLTADPTQPPSPPPAPAAGAAPAEPPAPGAAPDPNAPQTPKAWLDGILANATPEQRAEFLKASHDVYDDDVKRIKATHQQTIRQHKASEGWTAMDEDERKAFLGAWNDRDAKIAEYVAQGVEENTFAEARTPAQIDYLGKQVLALKTPEPSKAEDGKPFTEAETARMDAFLKLRGITAPEDQPARVNGMGQGPVGPGKTYAERLEGDGPMPTAKEVDAMTAHFAQQ